LVNKLTLLKEPLAKIMSGNWLSHSSTRNFAGDSVLILLTFACLFYLPNYSQAEEALSINGLRKNIETFKTGEDYRFAPKTIERSEAYLGAAMLATDQQKTDDVSSALKRASEMLDEARQTARSFKQQYRELLTLRLDSIAVVQTHAAATQAENRPSYQHLINSAEAALNASIQTMETGQLNKSRQYADEAKALYTQALEKTIPWLSEEAGAAVAKAAASSAKKYTPVTYQSAKNKLGELRAFVVGKTGTIPKYPVEALYLAHEAKALTQQIKLWRRKVGSYEDIVLKEKKFLQQMAQTLGLVVHKNVLLTDVSNSDIQQAVAALKKELADERKARGEDSARLKKHYEAELQTRLSALQKELLAAKNTQLADMKDAFRTKMKRTEEDYRSKMKKTEEDYRSTLEKETFETKRQKAVHALFKAGEVNILANLDGSLIIRLSRLKFASNKSKIDSKYFDMLGRLKEALDTYPDRNVRIEGHTDNRGEVRPNQKLSLRRAEAVRDFLIAAGTDGGRLKALGYGEVRPIASNEFEKGRGMNRRIDIAIGAAK
jgi:outer membrane protein OmpA-like peptidoglycan-associated protein